MSQPCRNAMQPSPAFGMLLTALLLLVSGCAGAMADSVAHLNRSQLSLNAPETLEMYYWNFSYAVEPLPDSYRVRATAFRKDNFPGWAEYVNRGWFSAYLADQAGNLLAQDTKSLYAGYFIPSWYEKGVDLEFTLPKPVGIPGPLTIAFGYNLTLTDARWGGSFIGSARSFDSDYDYFDTIETAR
ncbi:hypothetical protein V6C53_12070 [Desulfocurvibacter africanus]|uniref:Lipoprotein n=2 Tax=Desulfocurvibacter africanus TaxID=873 RepID=F3YUN2_DESAF|nr:hypothetical protein Desaf_0634 [Desulfocurvibacter africanus subsp. africanus str. Walvis Bay]